MALTFAFYLDAGLTQPAGSLAVVQASDGSSAAADRVVYFGSPVAGKKVQAAASPGVTAIAISLTDANTGGGVQASHVKLAASAAGLATATAGTALTLGTQILSGVAYAVAVYVRVDTPALTAGTYTDVALATSDLVEVAA